MLTFQVDFRPSRLRRVIIIILASCLLISVLMYFSGSLKLILLLLTMLTCAWAWREPQPIVQKLLIDSNAKAHLTINNTIYDAKLLSGSLIHPYLCCIKWQLPEHIIWQWILPDSTDKNNLRRLRVWAKFYCEST